MVDNFSVYYFYIFEHASHFKKCKYPKEYNFRKWIKYNQKNVFIQIED